MTTTKTKPITKPQIREVLKQIKAEFPNRVNPTDGGSCTYHNGGRGKSVRRCIIGQAGHKLGLPAPDPDEGSIKGVAREGGTWEGLFTPAAVEYMAAVQWEADGDAASEYEPKPWGEVKV